MKKLGVFIFTLLGLVSLANADNFKVGYINMDRVFSEAKPAQTIQKTLKDKYADTQASLQKQNEALANEQNQIQQVIGKASSITELSANDQTTLKNLQTKYQADQAQFQKQYIAFEQSLQKSQELALALLMNKTNAIISSLSNTQSFDLVLTSNQMIYSKAKYDITDQVLTQLNTLDTSDIVKQINTNNK